MTIFLLPIFSAVVDAVATVFDVNYTERGLKAGVGIEANEVVDTLARTNKPGALFLYGWNMGFIAAMLVACYLMRAYGDVNIGAIGIGGAFAGLLADAGHHVQGGLSWRYMLKGGKLDWEGFPLPADGNPVAHSAWAKFVGPWIW
jgi:hypothetical protein